MQQLDNTDIKPTHKYTYRLQITNYKANNPAIVAELKRMCRRCSLWKSEVAGLGSTAFHVMAAAYLHYSARATIVILTLLYISVDSFIYTCAFLWRLSPLFLCSEEFLDPPTVDRSGLPYHSCYLRTRRRWPNYLCIAYTAFAQL